ncbi:hypothetical protein NLC29_02160 [Candidatus Aminicenantes bacterium AH-873-B07]|nr:hypothetical protein [Candidatus Aminicenantes bacterium AH-873-B07]
MKIFKLFINGISTANSNFKIIIYLWIINFLFSLALIAPIYIMIDKNISKSLMGDRLIQGFDLFWLGDILYKFRNLSPALFGWLVFPTLFYLLLYVFLNGGIIGRLTVPFEKVNLRNFFADCGQYFWRFFKLFLISIIGYLVFLGLLFKLISLFLGIFTKKAVTEWPLIIVSNIKIIIFLLLFTIVKMFFDYVKIRLVISNSKKVIKETLFTLKFIGRRFLKAWGLYLLICLFSLIIAFIYMEIAHIIPKNRLLFVLAVFVWQQIYIFSRLWVKLIFFASEIGFYRYYI